MRILSILAACLVVSACSADETIRAYGAGERTWKLVQLNGQPFTAKATMAFTGKGQIAGQAPCNTYTATMDTPYPWFGTGPMAVTKRACPDLAAESAFLSALQVATISKVRDEKLILSNDDGLEMIFTAAD